MVAELAPHPLATTARDGRHLDRVDVLTPKALLETFRAIVLAQAVPVRAGTGSA